MPSNIVHNYFAKRVLKGIRPEIQELINNNKKAYLVGAQGPDLLFYLRYEGEPLNKLGETVHKSFNTYKMFLESGKYLKKSGNNTVLSFLFGQLCHYACDSNIHPYVYHREKDLPNYYTKPSHKYIHVVYESALDYICLRDFMKVKPRTFKGYKNLDIDKKSRLEIAKYYHDVVAPMYGMKLPIELGDKMIRTMRKFQWLTDDRFGVKYLIIRGLERLFHQPKNISAFMRPKKENTQENWMNYKKLSFPKYRYEDIMSTETVEELAKNAYHEAIELINDLYDYVVGDKPLSDKLYYRNYEGQRKINKLEEK